MGGLLPGRQRGNITELFPAGVADSTTKLPLCASQRARRALRSAHAACVQRVTSVTVDSCYVCLTFSSALPYTDEEHHPSAL